MNQLDVKKIVGSYSYEFFVDEFERLFSSSNEFIIEGIDNCNFQIQVCEKKEPQRHILQISVKKSNEKRSLAKITVSFLGRKITKIVDDWTNICSLTSEFPEITYKIIISCEIVWYGTIEDSSPIPCPLNLFSTFKNFHLNSALSDFKISISGEELPAHKFILAAHSSVFLSMFETDMKEKLENCVIIEGIELDVMKVVLKILYSGYDEDLYETEMALKVLMVAERYDMKILKKMCESKLSQKLKVSNVLDILEKADDYNAETLREICMDFIVENKKEMSEAEYFTAICHRKPGMVGKLLKKLMSTP